jgi:hypothetical protein
VVGSLALPGIAVADPSGDGANPDQSTAEEVASGANQTNGTTGTDDTSTQTQANAPAQATNEPTDDHDSTAQTEGAAAQESDDQAAASGSGEEDAGNEINANSSDNAPQPAAEPSADESSSAPAQQDASVDQAVSATATAEQHGNGAANGPGGDTGNDDANGNGNGNANGHDGNGNAYGHGTGNGNVHTEVRVDQPGSADGVSQLNQASADADATASTTVDSGGDPTISQAADASATATQDGIGNVHVSVRVGSPGDDGNVTQVNDAAATSSAAVDTAGASHADATATQEQVANTVVSVRVLSPGADGTVTQANTADAHASADDATATAVQDDVRNTYVGIRVQSPGERGAIEQSSSADADTTPGGTISVATDGLDTAVAVDVTAPQLTVPGATTTWEWIWVWHADESTLDGSPPFPVSGDSWSWNWNDLPGGTLVERQATDVQPGSWTWNWTWQRDVEGWAWDWSQTAALACACAWIWNWDWSWSGQPDSDGDTTAASAGGPPAEPDQAAGTPSEALPPPDQATIASASAVAQADASIGQQVEQDDADVDRFAGQIVNVFQAVDAFAAARQQLDAAGGLLEPGGAGTRSVSVFAAAAASTAVDQLIVQQGNVADSGNAQQWAGQQTEVEQLVSAAASGDQQLGRTGEVDGRATAGAVADSDNEQSAFQGALLGGGELSQWAGQLTDVVQLVDAHARTSQKVRNAGNVSATAKALSGDLSLGEQTTWQEGARGAGLGTQTAAQLTQVGQGAAAEATTGQTVSSPADAKLARSNAAALNRSLVLQTGVQVMNGAAAVDIQDLVQETTVVQLAYASSTSSGGIGGSALTVNCATTQQAASQGIGVGMAVGVGDLTAFCTPPVGPAPTAYGGGPEGSSEGSSQGSESTPAGASSIEQVASVVVSSTSEEELAADPGNTWAASSPIRHVPPPAVAREFSTERAPDAQVASGSTTIRSSQVSSPASPQARFDSRPEGSAGTKGVDRESPLPSTDGPLTWVLALAQGAAGSGGSGIVAILFAFVLTPSFLRRMREEADVRRPASVFAPLDVPV